MPEFSLSQSEVLRFHTDGYLGPYTLGSPHEMEQIQQETKRLFASSSNLAPPERGTIRQTNPLKQRGFGRHHDNLLLYKFITNPKIIHKAASILGPDLLLWRSMFFVKPPGEKRIPWHQDLDDWPIEPYLAVSAWIALSETTAENGCMEVIPGSHRDAVSLINTTDDVLAGFSRMAAPETISEENKVLIKMKPGEFILFNERLLHQSSANQSKSERTGLAVRFLPTLVRILDEADKPILISGKDGMGFNQLSEPPLT